MKKIDKNHLAVGAGIGCGILTTLLTTMLSMLLFLALSLFYARPVMTTNPLLLFPKAPGGKETSLTQPDQPPNNERADSIAGLYQQLNPGVVSIRVYGKEDGFTTEKSGSGFILDDQGYIVTNSHIVAGAEQVIVGFYNKQEVEAKIMGIDIISDLAVIKVDQLATRAHPLLLGDSDDVVVGEWVIAIGNPLGQQGSMSVGIVSGVNRVIPSAAPDFVIPGAIQTDADLNFGSSGGPLLNLRGEVIGLNTQITSVPLVSGSGIGFATPINLVQRIAPALMRREIYPWPWLGAQGGEVNPALRQANNLASRQGAYIDRVIPGSPAAKAGLQDTATTKQIDDMIVPVGGDVVVAADGQPIVDFDDLLAYVANKDADGEIELTIVRNGQPDRVVISLEPRPSDFIP